MKRNTAATTTSPKKRQKASSFCNNNSSSVTPITKKKSSDSICIGVLALQGAFREHITLLNKCNTIHENLTTREIRCSADLKGLSGLIIPGGESTAIAKIATRFGIDVGESDLFGVMREWIQKEKKPVWGTCAGLIFLANKIVGGEKLGGQTLIGGLDIDVSRNYFGKQIKSFEAEVEPPPTIKKCFSSDRFKNDDSQNYDGKTYTGVFIRAPAIMKTGKDVQTLSTVETDKGETVAVAVEQGQLLATAFHPELTEDTRWHEYFVQKCMIAAASN